MATTQINEKHNTLPSGISVLIVDDHAFIRLCIKQLLASVSDITVVGEAATGEQAIKFTRKFNPQVVLMDLQMPGIGGLEATYKIVQANPSIKVIAVTAYDEAPFPSRFIQAGASGYITKQTNLTELVGAIRQVNANQHYITPAIAQNMAMFQFSKKIMPFDTLSNRELQVMWMITQGDKVNSIADKLCLSSKTVNTYRYRLFEKLHLRNDVELTLMALHCGMIEKEQTGVSAE